MKVCELVKEDIKEYSDFAISIIIESPFYSQVSKNEWIKEFRSGDLYKNFEEQKGLHLIAKENKKIIGFCKGSFLDGGIFWINWIGVSKESRKQGIAKSILQNLMTMVSEKGIHKVISFIRPDNLESIQLFESLGFCKQTILRNHWFNQDFFYYYKYL